MSVYVIKIEDILSFWQNNKSTCENEQKNAIVNHLVDTFKLQPTEEIRLIVRKRLNGSFFNNYKQRLNAMPKNIRNFDSFKKVYETWVRGTLTFEVNTTECDINVKQGSLVGRPKVAYKQASLKTKRKRNVASASVISTEELCDIARKKLKLDGNASGSKLIDKVFDHEQANELLSASRNPKNSTEMSAEEALELLITNNMTTETYKRLRSNARMHGHELYPSYHKVSEAKKETYPRNVCITQTECSVPVQDLLEHTVKRLVLYLNLTFDENTSTELVLFAKYGFDGTNANRYKQKSGEKSSALDYLFCASLVPLQLSDKNTNKIYWTNSRPSSTRFCRPIKILYQKETDALIKKIDEDLKKEISELKDVKIRGCTINFDLMLTMIDGKVCNSINDTSSQRCFVCGASISQLNKINEVMNRNIEQSALMYGFSVLHAYIRFMELVLNISYRLEMKIWRVPKDRENERAAKKQKIQDNLHEELGILVDAPTQGSGNTNDGNTARRFFDNVKVVARVTGFDEELLDRLKIILAVISCGHEIDRAKFKKFTEDTAKRYTDLYNWYYMPPSMHVILLHGHQIMGQLFLPIGMMSEEAQEANNKNVKRFRDRFSRKTSRIDTNTDMFNRLLLWSDIYLSLLKPLPKKKCSELTNVMKDLLVISNNEEESDDSDIEQ